MLTTIRLRRAAFIALMLVCLCACGCADGVIRLLNTDLRIAPGVAYSTQEILTLEVDDADYILIDEVAIAHRQRGKLTALNVSKNTKLTYLTRSYNNALTALDVSKNTALTYLFCQNTALTELDLSQNKALYRLDCSNNALTALDVTKNTALEWLYCNNNALTALNLSQNTKLMELDCSNNALTALDVTKNTALEWLYCNNNVLTALDLSQNTKLTELDCSGQQAAETRVPQQADGSGRADLSGLVPGWSGAQGVQVQGGTLEADGSTVVWDGKTSPVTVSYAYRTGHQDVTMDAALHVYFDGGGAPAVITGANGVWQGGGGKDGLAFTSNADFADFIKVQVDSQDLAPSHYTAQEGSTKVTLRASYLATLPAGRHTIAIVSRTGTASAAFTIQAAPETGDGNDPEPVPETGDGSDPALWLTLALLSLCGLGALTFDRRRGAARR